jgi:hypothetical protein
VGCLQPSHRPRFLPVVRGGGYGVGFGGFSESLVEHLPRPMTAASMDIALLAAVSLRSPIPFTLPSEDLVFSSGCR